jgi:hypothetical protein
MDIKIAKKKYWAQKAHANERGIPFLLTLEQWCNIWEQSGKWEKRGKNRGQYCMSRYGDNGPYAIDNVFIQTNKNNVRDARCGIPLSTQTKTRLREAVFGVVFPKITCPHCSVIGGMNAMKRWHLDKCKFLNR